MKDHADKGIYRDYVNNHKSSWLLIILSVVALFFLTYLVLEQINAPYVRYRAGEDVVSGCIAVGYSDVDGRLVESASMCKTLSSEQLRTMEKIPDHEQNMK